jgi:hypothetical protein
VLSVAGTSRARRPQLRAPNFAAKFARYDLAGEKELDTSTAGSGGCHAVLAAFLFGLASDYHGSPRTN